MSEVASAFVTIVPSFKGGGRAIQKEFEGSLDGNAAGKKAGSGFMGGFGGSVKALAGGLAAGFAGGALVSGIMSSIDAASDLSETINKSTVIFGSNASAIDKWARGAATSMGLSRQAALDDASGFGDMFSQLGFSGDLAASMSQDVVQLSADLGSFNNLGTEDVAQRISAAFRGEKDSLQFHAFDLLHLDGWDLTQAGVEARKGLLAQVLAGQGAADPIRYSDHITGNGDGDDGQAEREGVDGAGEGCCDSRDRPEGRGAGDG